ncbi:MAG: MATE family efflux transporter [Epulopiscium sp.]|nr:MATE family efflux transporter [Candidatus Epulonipiscium sp.]
MDHSQFHESSVGKLLLKFSIPAIVGMVVNALYTVVDRFFIGKMPDVGALALSGVGAAFPIAVVIMSFGMLVGIGAGSRISIALGENNEERAAKILGNAFLMNIIFSIALSVLGLLFYKPILSAFGATASTMEYAQEYTVIILMGVVFTNTAFAMNNCIRGLGYPNMGMITLLLGAVTNIVLDPIFIFVLDMGVQGAAIATVISQIVSSIWAVYFLTSKKVNIPLRFENMKLDLQIILNIFAIGMSPFAMQLAAALVQILFNNNLNTYAGELGIGVFSSINSIIMLFFMPIFGINQGAQPIIGYYYGAKDYAKVRKTYILAAISATILASFGFLACQLAPATLLGIFNKEEDFLRLGVYGMRVFTAMLPVVGFQIVSSNLFQAIGEASTAMLLSLSRQVIMLIPLILILPKYYGLLGVWVSTPISDLLASVLTLIFIIRIFRKLSKIEGQARS